MDETKIKAAIDAARRHGIDVDLLVARAAPFLGVNLEEFVETPKTMQLEAPADDDVIRRSFGITVKSVSKEARSVDVIASNETIDAYNEIVEQDWDLSRYEKNPVVLYNHNVCGFLGPLHQRDTLPIGYAKNVRVEEGALLATLVFVDAKANEMAECVYQGFVQGSIRAVSVGFRSSDVIEEKRDDQSIYKLRGNMLCEISAVPMGANPDAVVAKRALDQLRRLAAKSMSMKSAPTIATAPRAEPTNDHAAGSGKENDMLTEAQIKALQDDLEAKIKALGVAEGRVTDLEKQLTAAKTDGATSESTVKTLTDELSIARKSAAGAVEARKSLGAGDDESLEDAAKRVVKSFSDANDSLLGKTLDDLVGKKILPAERENMFELAKTNKSLFDKIIADRPELNLAGKKLPVQPPHQNTATGATGANGGKKGATAPNALDLQYEQSFEDDADRDDAAAE